MRKVIPLLVLLALVRPAACPAAEQGGEEANPFLEKIFIPPGEYENDPPVSGKMAGDNCSACHGTQGRQFNESIPPLAGIPKDVFIERMMDFKAGGHKTIIMHEVARAFTDGEIERMADYFSQQPATPWLESNAKMANSETHLTSTSEEAH